MSLRTSLAKDGRSIPIFYVFEQVVLDYDESYFYIKKKYLQTALIVACSFTSIIIADENW